MKTSLKNVFVSVFVLLLALPAWANTYTYTGNPFTDFNSAPPNPSHLTIVVNTKSAPPSSGNISLSDISSFTISDGLHTIDNTSYNPDNTSIDIEFSNGAITDWGIWVYNSDITVGLSSDVIETGCDISTWSTGGGTLNNQAWTCTLGTWSTSSLSNLSVREECLFDWFEKTYPDSFTPAGSPTIVGQYDERLKNYESIRYYPATNLTIHISYAKGVYVTGDFNYLKYFGFPFTSSLRKILPWSGCDSLSDAKPPYPIIFIHGIGSSANDAWASPHTGADLRAYLINDRGWVFGGTPNYNKGKVGGLLKIEADFYTLSFSSNRDLDFYTQGGELSEIIKSVKANNPDKSKVILVAHSMGGLAARTYLQGIARQRGNLPGISYLNDVDRLITIGTPNFGTNLPFLCENRLFNKIFKDECKPSIALSELAINSPALQSLNDPPSYTNHPLPSEVKYISLVGIGTTNYFINYEDGDGIVTADSQNLGRHAPPPVNHFMSSINIKDRSECSHPEAHILGVYQTHTCETGDYGVWDAILRNVR